MKLNRRRFLTSTGLAGATLATGALPPATRAAAKAGLPKPRIKLAIASYSYWHFRTERMPIEAVIDKAAALGVEGVDLLHRQMDLPEKESLTAAHRAYLNQLKRRAFACGVAPVCLSTHQTFVNP